MLATAPLGDCLTLIQGCWVGWCKISSESHGLLLHRTQIYVCWHAPPLGCLPHPGSRLLGWLVQGCYGEPQTAACLHPDMCLLACAPLGCLPHPDSRLLGWLVQGFKGEPQSAASPHT